MADDDLEQIRRARLQQLREQGSAPGNESSEQDAKQQRANDQRASLLTQILTPDAADRLGRIRLVKASRATDVENRLLQLAQTGQLRAKVTEAQLKELLGAVAEQQDREEPRIVVERRGRGGGGGWDDDDDLDDLLKDV
ncbi:hypothetical protein PMIN06_010078 [Paraphaeosphaeria minitans]|uniref:Double-stranded DNA-binding domain-containing protein n=1 Tax=Paraphaeosphaeria minitans TaxID=565426 RepID=A0A9P6KPR0_9PLEO|nr:double-stranded DNA-binding domain-containing protein [Paraphaeosphaeria minitans]